MSSYSSKTNLRWWESEDPSSGVWQIYQDLSTGEGGRGAALSQYMRLYGNRDVAGIGPLSHAKVRSDSYVTLNVVKAVIDTITSRIAKTRPRPRFLTNAGNWSLKRRAKLLQRWADAQFHCANVYKSASRAFLDACVFGTGALKVYSIGTEIKVERVFPGEIYVDPGEGLYQDPKQIFQRKHIGRDVLKAMVKSLHEARPELKDLPKKLAAIDRAKCVSHEDLNTLGYGATLNKGLVDMVPVVEAWKEPSIKGSEDGRHALVIDGCTLLEEEWLRPLPFVFIRWSEQLLGFWGMGLAEELQGIQAEINNLLLNVQRAMHLFSQVRVWVEGSSGVKSEALNNDEGQVYRYNGQKPIFETVQTVHPEVFAHIENLYNKAFEIAGLTGLGSGNVRLPRLDSAEGIRELSDTESERFALVARQYEEAYIGVTERMIAEAKHINDTHDGYQVVTKKDRHSISTVKWSEVDLEEDAYVLQVFPSSSLPHLPGGRMDRVVSMLQAGLIDLATGKELIDFPDLESNLSLDRAVKETIERDIEMMLDEGKSAAPEPFTDLVLAMKLVQAAYNRGRVDGVPEANLKLLRQYLLALHALQQKAQANTIVSQPGLPPAPSPDGSSPMAVSPQDGTVR